MTAAPPYYRTNPQRLRQARLHALLTQEGLAEASGVCLDTVRRVEAGGRRYSRGQRAATVRRFASALNVPPRWLVEGT